MLLRSLCVQLDHARVVYDRWIARSYMAFVENARLLQAARDEFDRARSVQSDHVPWCTRCGERFDDGVCADDGASRRHS